MSLKEKIVKYFVEKWIKCDVLHRVVANYIKQDMASWCFKYLNKICCVIDERIVLCDPSDMRELYVFSSKEDVMKQAELFLTPKQVELNTTEAKAEKKVKRSRKKKESKQ